MSHLRNWIRSKLYRRPCREKERAHPKFKEAYEAEVAAVKGGDYKPDEIAGNQCVADNGGKTIVLEYIEGCSTTRVIESIQHKTEKP